MSFESETLPPAAPQDETRSGMRQLTLIAVFALMFLAGLIIIILFADPFDWNLLQRLDRNFDASAAAMPADTVAYVGVNLLEANVTRMTEIRDAFAAATAGTEFDFEEPMNELDTALDEELGIDFTEDIQPWIGQFMGIGLMDVALPDFESSADPTLNWVAAIEARNTEAADAFLAKLTSNIAEQMGETAVSETYQDITFTSFPSDDPLEEMTFGRSGSLVLIGSGLDAVSQAVDAQNGDSLADTIVYKDTLAQLPLDRLVTLYIDGTELDQFVEDSMAQSPMSTAELATFEQFSSTKGMKGIGMGLLVTDAGIQFDSVVTFDPTQLSELQQMSFNTWAAEAKTADIAPQDTLVYMSGSGLNIMWSAIRDLMMVEMSEAEFNESMSLFEQQFGLNPDTDFFPYLDGELAIIVAPSSSGLIADAAEMDLGLTLLVGTSDQAALADSVDTFSTAVGDPQMGMGTVEKTEADGLAMYELLSPMFDFMPINYGIGHDYLLISSGTESAHALQFDEDGLSLADSRDYQSVQAAFSDNRRPAVYVNVQGMLDTIGASPLVQEDAAEFDEATAVFRPIRYFASSNTISENTARGTVIIFIEAGE